MARIKLFTLGGTIAMRDRGQGAVPAAGPQELLADLRLDGGAIAVEAEAVFNLPSGHLTLREIYDLARRIETARAANAAGIVVTQGTDTLEETAFALDLLLSAGRPVVMTGAMRNGSELAPDGPANLRNALLAAASPALLNVGVVVVMNDQIHAAREVVKSHSQRLDSFRSRDGGPLGLILEDEIRITCRHEPLPRLPLPNTATARVPLLKTFLGDDGAVALALAPTGIHGLVVEGFGGGRVPPGLSDVLEDLARKIPVVVASRCAEGSTSARTYGYAGGERDLIRRGAIMAGGLSGVKARAALAILMDGGADEGEVRKFFSRT